MKFALINGNKAEAIKGLKGLCPNCKAELIAKCGEYKIHHWAHKGIRNCDPWWENETEWHRKWKNNFPDNWQEIPLTDEKTGEIHIADVRTIDGLVIEFQHSKIEKNERISRETFYKRMVWIVDGSRLKKDYPRFLKGKNGFRKTNKLGYYFVDYPIECFHSSWLESSMPVIFDFQGTESPQDINDMRNPLYCLFPKGNNKESVLAIFSRESFVSLANSGKLFMKQEVQPKQTIISQNNNGVIVKRREPTHYYDPRKKRMVKRWRF